MLPCCRDEVEKLFQQEQARQRRLQHDDADSADNGPKEISIHCHSKVSVNIVDLDAAQRDRNECMYVSLWCAVLHHGAIKPEPRLTHVVLCAVRVCMVQGAECERPGHDLAAGAVL